MSATIGIVIIVLLVVLGIMHAIVWIHMRYYQKQNEELINVIGGCNESASEFVSVFYLDSKNEKFDEYTKGFNEEAVSVFNAIYGQPICATSNMSTVYSWDEDNVKIGLFINNDEYELPFTDAEIYFIDISIDAAVIGKILQQTQGNEKRVYFFGSDE